MKGVKTARATLFENLIAVTMTLKCVLSKSSSALKTIVSEVGTRHFWDSAR